MFEHIVTEIGLDQVDLDTNYIEEAKKIAIQIFSSYIAHESIY